MILYQQARRHNVNELISNIIFFIFALLVTYCSPYLRQNEKRGSTNIIYIYLKFSKQKRKNRVFDILIYYVRLSK